MAFTRGQPHSSPQSLPPWGCDSPLRDPDQLRTSSPNNLPCSKAFCAPVCLPSCDTESCNLAVNIQPCTDQCVVVSRAEALALERSCPDLCLEPSCDMQPCDGGPNCSGSLEEFLECCTDYHAYFEDNGHPKPPQLGWAGQYNPIATHPQYLPYATPQGLHHPRGPAQSRSTSSPRTTSENSHALDDPLNYNGLAHPTQRNTPNLADIHSYPFTRPTAESPPAYGVETKLLCLWANCGLSFQSMEELVGHVNLTHLRLPAGNASAMSVIPAMQEPFSCLWDNCHISPNLSIIAGPSKEDSADVALNVLSNHLLQDHLGLAFDPSNPFSLLSGSLSSFKPQELPEDNDPSAPASHDSPGHDCSGSHVCAWEGCGQNFNSCDDLTVHISSVHVGSGKGQYHCYWDSCNRHGEQGFSSKQKILRHLQSHTGHRPFQCSICNQNFSEAATLQQHMRRHTQEKPYVCDFPGCNKAFAITGALTIHKRTHNGERPFKCTHCGRAFAESSNLSKHLRTHTGVRPYACSEPGCEKTFARPDQLARHSQVHEKKRKNEAVAMQVDE